jgi:hypothetical protein
MMMSCNPFLTAQTRKGMMRPNSQEFDRNAPRNAKTGKAAADIPMVKLRYNSSET